MTKMLKLERNGIAEFAADAVARCDTVVSELVEKLGNLGALVSIEVEGADRIALTAGHSDIEQTRAVQADDIFAIGSQSKTITAMILFLLARDGLLRLDDPVLDHVELPIDRRIAVRHLLMNASGIGEYTFAMFGARLDPRVSYVPRDLVAMALPQGQLFDPGDRFDYCNTGWVIAAMVIEAVTGEAYGKVAADRICAPLGLMQSGFGGIIPPGHQMRGYRTITGETDPIDTTNLVSFSFGAGDGLCSAADISKIYGSLLRSDSPLGISLADLARETLGPVERPYFPSSIGTEYGLGLERRFWAGSEVWGHPGSTGPCRSSTWIDAERGVTVATAVTVHLGPTSNRDDIVYPRAQLFSMVLATAYAIAAARCD